MPAERIIGASPTHATDRPYPRARQRRPLGRCHHLHPPGAARRQRVRRVLAQRRGGRSRAVDGGAVHRRLGRTRPRASCSSCWPGSSAPWPGACCASRPSSGWARRSPRRSTTSIRSSPRHWPSCSSARQVTLPILAATVVIVTGATLLSMGGKPWGFARSIWCSRSCRRSASASWPSCESWPWPRSPRFPVPPSTSRPRWFWSRVPHRDRATAASLACDGRSFAYFVGAGLTENLSVFLTVVALGLGTVSVVTPLTSTSPIFVLLLSPLLLRGVERVTVTDRPRDRPDRARRLPDHRARPLIAAPAGRPAPHQGLRTRR